MKYFPGMISLVFGCLWCPFFFYLFPYSLSIFQVHCLWSKLSVLLYFDSVYLSQQGAAQEALCPCRWHRDQAPVCCGEWPYVIPLVIFLSFVLWLLWKSPLVDPAVCQGKGQYRTRHTDRYRSSWLGFPYRKLHLTLPYRSGKQQQIPLSDSATQYGVPVKYFRYF